ncbi:transcriptional regulator, TetR family [Paenibacillus sp. BC26]|nr:transcriptional regulator, TetR family [Paenibacillus sp. BC26]
MLNGDRSACQDSLFIRREVNIMMQDSPIPTPPPRSERRDAAENRQRILDAAIRLFDQHGVEQVSMNQIASEAQIGPGTLYRRYRNKGELCHDLMKENIILLFENIEAHLLDHRTAPPSERLQGLLSLFIGFREKKSQLLKGVEDSASTNRFRSRTQSPLYVELHQLLVELFDEMAVTDPSRQPNSVFKADMLLMALSSESYSYQKEERGYSSEQFLEQIRLTFLPQSRA